MQIHEESRALKTLTSRFSQLASELRSNTSDQARLFGERSFLGPNCRTKKEQTGGVIMRKLIGSNRFVSAHISGALPDHVEVASSHHY